MAIGYSIRTILNGGTTKALIQNVYDGKLPRQGSYPAVQIPTDFSVSVPCKDGEVGENFTVTVIAWADTKATCEQIVRSAKADLINQTIFLDDVVILPILFEGRGPWLRDEEKLLWGRPADFIIRT